MPIGAQDGSDAVPCKNRTDMSEGVPPGRKPAGKSLLAETDSLGGHTVRNEALARRYLRLIDPLRLAE